MTRRLKLLVALGAVCVVAVAGYAGVKRKAPETTQASQPVIEFTTQDLYIVEPRTLERTLPLTGSLTPFTEATVKAKVAGELVAVPVREGEPVKRGQVLARIDQTEVQARVAARRADVSAARAQLDWAGKNRTTQKALLEKGFIAQTAYDNVQSNFEVAVARLRAAEAELVVAQKALGDSVLLAPFDGIVSLRHAQAGERVALDAKVVSVVDLSRLQLEAAVPASEIGRLQVGQPVAFRVDGFGAQSFAGRIDRISPATVSGSRSINVYAVIDNPQGVLRSGLFAQGAVSLERIEGALVVPASAVREELGRNTVYALVDGAVRRRAVTIGPADAADRVQVLEGLAPGDRIVRANLGTLREGIAARLAGPQPEASR
jgi:membrane fusion protein (multidrug efflux system)